MIDVRQARRIRLRLRGGTSGGAGFVDAGQVNLGKVTQPSELPSRVPVLRAQHSETNGRPAHVGRSSVEGGRTISGICISAGRVNRRKKCPSPEEPSMKSGL